MKRSVALAAMSLLLGVLGLYLAARGTSLEAAAYVPTRPSAALAVAAVGCLSALWFVPALRLQYLAARHGYRLGARTAWLAHLVTMFGSAVTPGGTGGAPTLVAALGRMGIPLGTGIGIAFQTFVLDLVAFAWLVPLGLVYLVLTQDLALPRNLEAVAVLAALLAVAAALSLGRHPRLVVRLMLTLSRRRLLRRWQARLRQQARSYYRSARTFAAIGPGGWLWLQVVTLAGWAANFALLWTFLAMFGTDAAFLGLMAFMSVVTLISFVVPTPGASGFTELVVGLGTGAQAGAAPLAPLVLWRLASFYVTYLLGPLASWALLLRPGRALPRQGGRGRAPPFSGGSAGGRRPSRRPRP